MRKVGGAIANILAVIGVASLARADALSPTQTDVPLNPQREAYFGDLHLHTGYSFDAHLLFGVHSTPDEAYRFARGQSVQLGGREIQRTWPLDFLAVTDHSEDLGVMNELDDAESAFSRSELGQKLRKEGKEALWSVVKINAEGKRRSPFDPAAAAAAWQKEIDAANANYQPGKFTSLIGYEWSPMLGNKAPHRIVIFGGNHAPLPFSALDSRRPEDLWTYLEEQRRHGFEVLAITSHPNLSGGLSYEWNDAGSGDYTADDARRRAINEPLSEIASSSQAETHPVLSPGDEFAGFELREQLLMGGEKGALHGSYVREALGRGLVLEQKLGANPFKFGVVGVTDNHTGFSVSDEAADFDDRSATSKSLTGVWAQRNTREAIFDALRRRETFATTGTRLKLRFFGGWTFTQAAMRSKRWIETAYASGVTMGAELTARPAGAKAPRFIIWAAKDPSGANLDRVQVVKLWIKDGGYAEQVFDVAHAGRRKPDASGALPPLGNTVDIKQATYANSIGASSLSTVWEDPDFDPRLPAAYYLRALEIPTPRRSTIEAVSSGKPLPTTDPAVIQERAWSSPIWYSPRQSTSAAHSPVTLPLSESHVLKSDKLPPKSP